MPIKENLPPLANTNLHRNVSINLHGLIPQDVRKYYQGQDSMGVYTTGNWPQAGCAVAVTGMTSCGGLILVSNEAYLAIHLGGDATAVKHFKEVIKKFIDENPRHHLVTATGPDGSSDYLIGAFKKELGEIFTDKHVDEIDIWNGVRKIACTPDGTTGEPSDAICNPTRRPSGSTSCFDSIGKNCVIM